ncbi:MAG TPA: tape measure protein [Nitrososphaera sp.]|nr:tape measure protein [Nitrososphaera sp.]
MPISAAQLVGTVTIDGADAATLKLNLVSKAVDETQGKMKGGLLGGLKSAAGGLLDFGAKLGQTVIGFRGLVDGAISVAQALLMPNASMEQTTVGFETMLGKGKATQAFLEKLKDFAAATPFEFPELAEDAQHMLAFGFSAKEVIPTLTNIGDAMGAMGKSNADIERVVTVFGQMKAAGKVNAQDMMQLTSQGIPAWRFLADAMHLSVAQVRDLSEKGLLPANEAIKNLQAGMHKMFGGGMAAESRTFLGLWSTIKDNAEAAWRSFTGPLFEQAKTGISQLGNMLSGKQFQEFATMMGERVGGALKQVEVFVRGNIIPAFNDFMRVIRSPEMATLVGKLGELGTTLMGVVSPALADSKRQSHDFFDFLQHTAIPALTGLVSALTQSIKFVRDHGAQFQAAGVIIAGIYTPAIIKAGVESVIAGAKSSASFVTSIVKTGIEGWQAAAKLQLWIGEIIASGARAVVAGAQITISFVGSMVKAGVEALVFEARIRIAFIGSMVKAGVEATIAGAKVVASFVASMIAAGAQAVVTGAKIVASFIAALISAAVEAAVSAGVMLSTLVPALAAVAVEVIAATWPFLLAGVVIAAVVVGIVLAVRNWGAIAHWLQGVWGGFSSWFMGILGQVGAFFQAAWQRMLSVAQSIWAGIVAVVRSNAYLLLAIVIGPIGALTVYILTHWEQVAGATRQLGATITGIFSSWAGAAYNAGVSIVSQVVAGIQSMIGQAGAAMSNLAAEISAHLPKSPAKKGPLTDIHKRMPSMVKMLSEGIEAGVPRIEASIRHLVAPMSMKPQSSFGTGGTPYHFAVPHNSPPQIIVQPAPVYLDGRQLMTGLMPHFVNAVRNKVGVYGM